MSTWLIEHVRTATTRSSIAWGFAAVDWDEHNWAAGTCVLTVDGGTSATAAPMWLADDKIILWRDGARVWHGWLRHPEARANASSESQTYIFDDAWRWLEKVNVRTSIATKDAVYGDIPGSGTPPLTHQTGITWVTPLGDVVWTNYQDVSPVTVQGQIRWAFYSLLWAGRTEVALGSISIDLPAPAQAGFNQTCAAWLQCAAGSAPMSSGVWDYSGTVPIFNAHSRAASPTYTQSLGNGVTAYGVTPLHELQIFSVRINYRYIWSWPDTGIIGGVIAMPQTAGDATRLEGPGTLIAAADYTNDVAINVALLANIPQKLFDALSVLAWAGTLELHELAAPYALYRPGHAINCTGGNPDWATMAALVQGVTHRVTAGARDICTVTMGAPEQLGIQDWLAITSVATSAAGAAGAPEEEAAKEEAKAQAVPGTIPDLSAPEDLSGAYDPAGGTDIQSCGGSMVLCGWPEYSGHVSSPPRFYRNRTLSGTYVGQTRSSGLYVNTSTWTFSGVAITSSTSGGCAVTQSANRHYSLLDHGGTTTDYGDTAVIEVMHGGSDTGSTTYTATTATSTGNDYWHDNGNQTEQRQLSSATAVETLSGEVSDSSAVDQILAANAWGGASNPATAVWAPRTSGSTVVYSKIRFRAAIQSGQTEPGYTGCKAWFPYSLTASLSRSAVNEAGTPTGSWEQIAPVVCQSIANMDGFAPFPDWVEITAPQGYAVRIDSLNFAAK